MMRLKGCPRCRGDMYLEASTYDVFWVCLQCGNAVAARFIGKPSPVPVPVTDEARSGVGARG